tara:strand:+ start:9907 stop:10119 length:213 start_codon:yes stop_codon:yes gene_type:complete
MIPRSRKNSFDKKYRSDSIDSCSKEFCYEQKKDFISIPRKKRRIREQPLEIKDPSPVPDKFRYLLILEQK